MIAYDTLDERLTVVTSRTIALGGYNRPASSRAPEAVSGNCQARLDSSSNLSCTDRACH